MEAAQIGFNYILTTQNCIRTTSDNITTTFHCIKRNADRQTYGKLTYDVMEAFIAGHETDDKKRAAMLKEYCKLL